MSFHHHHHNYHPKKVVVSQLSQCSTSSDASIRMMIENDNNQRSSPLSSTAMVSNQRSSYSFHPTSSAFENCPISIDSQFDGSSLPPPIYTPPPPPPPPPQSSTSSSSSSSTSSPMKSASTYLYETEPPKPFNYCKLAFKLIIVLVSFAGFLYQATDICTHYFSYRTVVYTNTEQDSLVDLPSITFCLPTYFTKRTIEDLYEPYIKRNVDESAAFKNRSMLDAITPVIYETFQVC